MSSNGNMSEYAVDRDQRPLLDQEGFSETEILERLRDNSPAPRYGTFVGGAPPPVVITERIVEPSTTTPLNVNNRPKRYRLSFLILLSFDVGLIIFLSVMCYLTSSDPGDHTITGYFNLNDFDTSVFDLVLVSVTRFVCNVLFYILLGWITRIILFLTTLLSTLYVPVKAFFFWERLTDMDQSGDSKIIILYIIVLLFFFSAFAIPWLIAFFFEFKFLPTERSRITVTSWFDYRPWLCPWMLHPKAESHQAPTTQIITTTQQVPASLNRHQSLDTVFRTPVGSIRGSPTSYLIVDDDLGTIREEHRQSPSPELLPAECDQLSSTDARFCQMGDQALQGLTAQVSTNNGWRLVKEQDDVKCYCTQDETRKIYKAEMIVPVSADRLWAVIYHDVENTKNWNSGVAANEILQKIDNATDILYTLCTTIGPVSPRDFVTVRRWDLIQGVYYDANVSTQHSAKPIQRDPVRGENGPGGYAVIPIEAQKCKFVWVFNSNLKGWILQSVLEQIVPTTLVNTSKSLRSYVCGLSSNA